jgi:hypothetical protein
MNVLDKRFILLVTLGSLLTALSAARSEAGTYDVSGCEEDTREKLPSLGWSLAGPASAFHVTEDCASGPTVVKAVGEMAPGTAGGIRLRVPRPLSITAFKMRTVTNAQYSPYTTPQYWWNGEVRLTPVGRPSVALGYCPGKDNGCTNSYGASPVIDDDPPAEEIAWLLRCAPDSPGRCRSGSSIQLLETWFRITDPVRPDLIRPPAGALISGAKDIAGTDTTAFEVSDAGGGVFRAVLEIDGQAAAESPFNNILATCRLPFRTIRPCPGKVAGTLDVDTTKLVDGPHEAVLQVYDATNTNKVTYGPVSFETVNRRADSYCGVTEASRVRLSTPRRTLRYGQRFRTTARVFGAPGWEAVLLDGRALVSVVARGTVAAQGRLTLNVPAGPSRHLRLAVRPPGSRSKYVCSAMRSVPVKASISLHVGPRRVSNGRSVHISGRLRGRSHGHRSVIVQARAVGNQRWATVKVVRTARNGRYRMRYRFLNTFSDVIYVFRSQVRSEKGYAYATGHSAPVQVRVAGG